MRAAIVCFLLVLATGAVLGQTKTGTITGIITDSLNKPLPYAIVKVKNHTHGGVADVNGSYTINNVTEGAHTIVVSLLGYSVKEQAITVQANKTTNLNIQLKLNAQKMCIVEVTGIQSKNGIGQLAESVETVIYSGKKTEVLVLDSLDANKAQNNPRQVLGRIPGMNFSETEGSGFPSNGFGLRGLNPSQSVEMNVRQNGYNITSDLYGYNESYYNPALEGVERIEITRGASSLQFGPQFGGVVNFIMKQAPKNKVFEYTTQQTAGSFNLFNSFHSVGGTYKKFSYYAFGQYKSTDGWRPNSDSKSATGYARVEYNPNNRLKVGLEYSILRNRIHMSGGLSDDQFNTDSRQSFRSRNWITTPWNIITGTVDYTISENTRISFKSTYLFSQRNLVWRNEDGGPAEMDSISPVTNSYVPREVEHEGFASTTNEVRILSNYNFLGMKRNTVAGGLRYSYSKMQRQGGGPGSTGTDFDLNLYGGEYEYSLDYTTTSIAPFIENIFRITDKWSVTPGFRFEYLVSTSKGYVTDSVQVYSNLSRKRYIPLAGVGTQYRITPSTAIYANWSQAYRPMDYSALTPIGVTSVIDPNLKDASGYNADFGWRGAFGNYINFDVGGFYLKYNNRIGLLTLLDNNNQPYTLRTNTGNSVSMGVETYIEINPVKFFTQNSRVGNISLFNSFAYVDATYKTGTLDEDGNSIAGNRVEYSPKTINRFGATYSIKGFSATFTMSNVAQSYGDANNTVASSDAVVGIVPKYKVYDLSAAYKYKNYNIKVGVNNLTDERYYTKRTDEYPGPGIIPSIGRSFYLTLGAKF